MITEVLGVGSGAMGDAGNSGSAGPEGRGGGRGVFSGLEGHCSLLQSYEEQPRSRFDFEIQMQVSFDFGPGRLSTALAALRSCRMLSTACLINAAVFDL